jgi:uncharacterized protein
MLVAPLRLFLGAQTDPSMARRELHGVAVTATGEEPKAEGGRGGRQARRLPVQSGPLRLAGAAGEAEQQSPAGSVRIGVLSDNHGYFDPVILERFAGVIHIIHAGDIMDPDILTSLETVAPVTAVAGNLDSGDLAERLPREVSGEIAGVRFLVGHKPKRLLNRLSTGKIEGERPDLVVWGHTHVPSAAWVDGALYLNPGTASSPDEEDDGPTVAIVEVEADGLAVRFIPLARRRVADVADADRGRKASAG